MTTAAALPVFGDTDDEAPPTTSFVLIAKARYNGKSEKRRHNLTAYAETDAGSLLTMLGGKQDDTARQFRGMASLLLRVLVDDDGVPADVQPRLIAPDKASTDTPQLGDDTKGELATTDDVPADATWRFVFPDGTPLDDADSFSSLAEAQTYAVTHPSSKRRFLDVIADPEQTVDTAALSQIVEHIASEAAGRPTKPSQDSSGSAPRRTRRART